ncbi:MCP four helix bundle domain-containing protein [Marivirga salinae]|uniref:MCP four helix bundle domain-containing protein n=1 Tax=Marivirga salinarum TaxID=3059078 RepID=A0AA51RAV4_9BACT|nr:MCP four helix bundle domain-containing protein [Marivirga sp. BDSF4-3]WMN11536.1 MCP four helix bundle domain-containing protein [Marivirga sp. BDSF4-3]
MKLYNKIKWVLGILMIITLVITTNLVDRNNFLQISNAIETIYEDRLVAKDLIFKISALINKKEIAAIKSDSSFYANQNNLIDNEIDNYLLRYDQTKLTTKEREILGDFKVNYQVLKENESEFIQSNFLQNALLFDQFPEVKSNLENLAAIQLKEGGRQLQISRRAMDSVELFTQIEIYILIFLAIIVQIIVMYKPKEEE